MQNLQISIDSNRYEYLRQRNQLPSLTMELNLYSGSIKGVGIFSLIFGKSIHADEILSKQADIRLSRHVQVKNKEEEVDTDVPLWKSIQPKISSISVGRIKLDGIKLLYKNADTSTSVKLQFDECNALFEYIRIDSTAAFDTTRIGFTKNVTLKFHDLKFRTSDSTYKMKAEWISYSSKEKTLQVDSFNCNQRWKRKIFIKQQPSSKACIT